MPRPVSFVGLGRQVLRDFHVHLELVVVKLAQDALPVEDLLKAHFHLTALVLGESQRLDRGDIIVPAQNDLVMAVGEGWAGENYVRGRLQRGGRVR